MLALNAIHLGIVKEFLHPPADMGLQLNERSALRLVPIVHLLEPIADDQILFRPLVCGSHCVSPMWLGAYALPGKSLGCGKNPPEWLVTRQPLGQDK
jgi:hypothetical protein